VAPATGPKGRHDGARQAVYFGGHSASVPLLVIAAYAAVGAALTVVASRRAFRSSTLSSWPARATPAQPPV